MTAPQQPAGWFDDPHAPGRKRYWDGKNWTYHVVDAATGAPVDVPGLPTAKRPWWQTTGGVIGLALAGLFVGVALGASGQQTKTQTQTATVASTVTNTQTAAGPVRYKTRYRTRTKTVRVQAQAAAASSSAGDGSGGYSFSGNGGKNLGTLHIPSGGARLAWTNDGGIFQILTDGPDVIPVNSQGHSGTTELSGGSWPNFQVNAAGNWTIRISPH